MAGFFYNLGRLVGPKVRKADWVYQSLTGSEAEAARPSRPSAATWPGPSSSSSNAKRTPRPASTSITSPPG